MEVVPFARFSPQCRKATLENDFGLAFAFQNNAKRNGQCCVGMECGQCLTGSNFAVSTSVHFGWHNFVGTSISSQSHCFLGTILF